MSCTGVRNNLKQFKKIHYQNYSLSSQLLFQSCRECILLITTRMLFAKFCLKTKIVDTTNKLIDWYHLDFWTFTGISCKNYPLIKLKKKSKTNNKKHPKTIPQILFTCWAKKILLTTFSSCTNDSSSVVVLRRLLLSSIQRNKKINP